MVEQGCSPCGTSKHNSRGNIPFKVVSPSKQLPPTRIHLPEFPCLPIVHPLINPSMDRSTDEVRILTIQHLSERSPLIGDEALDLWDTVHTQTMANIHCKREKIYRCSKRTLQFTIYIFNKSNNLTWSRESSSLQKAESSCINKGSFFSQPS